MMGIQKEKLEIHINKNILEHLCQEARLVCSLPEGFLCHFFFFFFLTDDQQVPDDSNVDPLQTSWNKDRVHHKKLKEPIHK